MQNILNEHKIDVLSLSGEAALRQIWHQFVADMNSEVQNMELDTPQPVSVEMYHATCSATVLTNKR